MTAGEAMVSPGATPDVGDPEPAAAWRSRDLAGLVVGLVAAALLRIALLPADGSPDLDQFVGWAHAFATGLPLGQAYRLDLSFPPVMTSVIWAVAKAAPVFATAVDSTDVAARIALKVPASAADLGLALGVAWLLRDRPRLAVAGALLVAFVPVTWLLSAWWGQFESIYVLLGLVATILLLADRPLPAAAALGLALMTKPQALPFVVPFAAYTLGRYGWRRGAVLGAVAAVTAAATWLPFLADGGPARYAANLAHYQDGMFAVLSLRAWNPWWVVQELTAGGSFVADTAPLVGPVTPRMVGYGLAAIGALGVFLLGLRRPTRDGLLLGLTATVLVTFSSLTTMHERYSYGAVVFLLPVALIAARRTRAAWVVLVAAVTTNLVAAVPADRLPAVLVEGAAALWPPGCAAILGATAFGVAALRTPEPRTLPERG